MSARTFALALYLGLLLLAVPVFGLGGPALAAAWGGGDLASLAAVATAGALLLLIQAGYGAALLRLDAKLRDNKDKRGLTHER